jgi:DhnA family fructose-bisphosphate aldolase class Ia
MPLEALTREERLNRIFARDGRSLCIASDHGLMTDPHRSWMRLRPVVEAAVHSRADGLLLSLGQILRLGPLVSGPQAPALIVRTDWCNLLRVTGANGCSVLPVAHAEYRRLYTAREALVEASATAAIGFLLMDAEGELECQTVRASGELADECREIGLPCILEVLPVTPEAAEDLVRRGTWLAAELGADIIKIPFGGDSARFRALRRDVDRPLLVLGGGNLADVDAFTEHMRGALDAGADGLIVGRNVAGSSDPAATIGRLRQLVHGT